VPEESARCGQTVNCYGSRRTDAMAAPQRVQQGVRHRERVAAWPAQARTGNLPGDAAWEGRSKHFSKEFEAFALTLMREMPVKKAGKFWGNRPADVADVARTRGGSAAQADWSGWCGWGPTR